MDSQRPGAISHTGNIRSNNEDAFFSDPRAGLFLVADGMGGHAAGEVASAITRDTISRMVIRQGKSLSEAIRAAHHAVLAGPEKKQGIRGMGSTVVSLRNSKLPDQDVDSYEIAWVGDSRAYLWGHDDQGRGELRQLSSDHSFVQALLDSGAITEEEVETHPERNIITQCLGSVELADVRVDTVHGQWKEHDKIILCSDGLTDELSDQKMANILANARDAEEATQALINAALAEGGRDNVTVIVVPAPTRHATEETPFIGKLLTWASLLIVAATISFSAYWLLTTL